MADATVKVLLDGNSTGAVNAVDKLSQSLNKLPRTTSTATQSLINLSRVAQDAPYGFIGIANNLNPLLESFQRLRAETGSNASAMTALRGAMVGPAGIGLALGVVSSLLVSFGDRIFKTSASFSEAEISAAKFGAAIRRVKDDVESLKQSLDLKGKLQKIGLELSGLSGAGLTAAGRIVDIKNNTQLISELDKKISALSKSNNELVKSRLAAETAFSSLGGQTSLGKALIALKGDVTDLTDDMVKKFSSSDQALIQRYKQTNQTVKDLLKQRNDLVSENIVNIANIPIDFIREGRVEIDKIRVKPKKIEIDPQLSDYNIIKPEKKDFTADTSKLKLTRSDLIGDAKASVEAQIKPIRDDLLELVKLGEYVGNSVATAFDKVFDSIASGGNAFRALGEAVRALVIDLIKAAVRAFIIKAIVNAIAPGAGSAADLGALSGLFDGLPGRASGGPVAGNRAYVVGERGRELFVPSTSGRILPNAQLGGISGSASQMISGNIGVRIAGRDLVGVLSLENSYQRRNV